MIWVCRAGQNSAYIDNFIEDGRIYLPWSGFKQDLSLYSELKDFKTIVLKEKKTDNKTTISNLASQLKAFVSDECWGLCINSTSFQ